MKTCKITATNSIELDDSSVRIDNVDGYLVIVDGYFPEGIGIESLGTTGPVSHNSTTGIQGGSGSDGYYHLTAAQQDWLTDGYADGYWRVTKGGTGLTNCAAGDILYASATNTLAALPKSLDGYYLVLSSGLPAWIPLAVAHNSTTSIQGGSGADGYYHLTATQQTALTGGSTTTLHTHAHNNTTSIQGGSAADGYYHLTATQHTDLTDGGETILHTHAHNNTTSIQGGSAADGYYHLTSTQHSTLTTSISKVDGYLTFTDAYTSATTLFEIAAPSAYIHDFTDSDLSTGILTITHGLNNKYVTVNIYDGYDKMVIPDDITLTDAYNCSIDLTTFGTLYGTWHAVVSVGATASISSTPSNLAYDQPHLIPDMFTWTGPLATKFPTRDGTVIRLGTKLYCFGGYAGGIPTNSIYSTDWDDPEGWALVGTLPFAMMWPRVALIGTNLYIFGSSDAVNAQKILTATAANPLSWTDIGNLPVRRDNAPYIISNNKAIIYKGHDGSMNYGTALICSDITNTPTIWNLTTFSNGAAHENSAACFNNTIISVCGTSSSYKYQIGNSSKPEYLTTNAYGAVTSQSGRPGIIHVENSFWVLGTASYTICEISVSSDGILNAFPISHENTQPTSFAYSELNHWYGPDGKLYVIDRYNNDIYCTGTKTIYTQVENVASTKQLEARDEYDNKTRLTRSCRLGFSEWHTNRTDLI